ncbi:semaphorin-6D-like [Hippocampus zosterae]|uniref:semaphorin-6D-like n=1 Tax=Hippocampus zosterae TaxID=109293 RepID=UPI00223E62E7|nr:semaphorin-6D-like [Hippocampus zosterae]XP_051925790.1 semaphorin-6D-like [Hippocampus zosterae]
MALTNRSSVRPSLLLLTSWFLCAASSFPRDLQAISVLDESGDFPVFQSMLQDNQTRRLGLHFQGMTRVNRMLFITARDHVFAVNLTTAAEAFVPQMTLTWRAADVSKCAVRGKDGDECYNYIKVLVPRDDETLFVCGTNAFNPACRNYKMSTLEQVGSDLPGQARCPFESGQSNAGTFAGGDFYSATVTDFLASDAVIYRSLGDGRPVLRTVKYDSKWLREPRFLHAVEYGRFVYFFLSEIAAEYTTLGKVVFSRVARVCKNDNGGSPRVLDKHWTSFLKARLNCSLPGESLFYFDVLQSLTGVLQINGRPAVLAVFTTQANSIPGSAVCAFYMDDVEEVFSGKFKEQRGSDSSWTAAPEDAVPRPRPGSCAGDGPAADFKSSVDFPDETLAFVKSFPLMDGAVPAVNRRPFYTRTASGSKLTQIAADVSAGPRKERAVVFLGSEDGRVAKVLLDTLPHAAWGARLLEDIDVYDPDRCDLGVREEEDRRVLGLELDKEHHALFVAFGSCLVRVPLSRCGRHGACKRACLTSRDPYCIWLRTGRCADAAPGFKAGFEQDIEGDHSNMAACAADVSTTSRDREMAADSAYGVRGAAAGEEDSASRVHYTLLIACALLAFSLGAASSGLLVLRFRGGGCRDARRNGTFDKDPEASLPGASSPPPLAKLGGLPDPAPEEDKTAASPGPDGRDSDPVTARHRLPAAEPRVTLTRGDGELGALPAPNSGSEYPWQMKSWDDPAPFAAVTGAERPAPPAFPPTHLCGDGQPSADVSALDDLLRHIQQVSARGDGGIRVLTSASSGHLHPPPPPRGKTRALSFNRRHQPASVTEALPLKANGAILPQRVIPEAPVRPRGPALVKIGGNLPRRRSFNRGAAPSRQRLLARMNSYNSGGPSAPPAPAGGGRRRAPAAACLTRQHSYSEGVHLRRANVPVTNASAVRRAVSLKPKLPPKPLFLPDVPTLFASEPSGR